MSVVCPDTIVITCTELHQNSVPNTAHHFAVCVCRVQRGYALQLAGRDKEAAAEYSAVLLHKVEDPALLAILHNNVATLNRDGNIFDSRKKMKATMVSSAVLKNLKLVPL